MANECITCSHLSLHKEGKAKSPISTHGTVLSFTAIRPLSKGHLYISTFRHINDARETTDQEWADILPVLKESISKIDKVYHPLGYRITIPTGKLANQNQPFHFFCRFAPKYKKYWGNVSVPTSLKKPSLAPPERSKEIEKALQPNSKKVIAEKSKIVAKFNNNSELMIDTSGEKIIANTIIYTKSKLPNDINTIDEETWAEIGAMLKELMKKMEDADVAHDFKIEFCFGKEVAKINREEAGVSSADSLYSDSEFIVTLFPQYGVERWYKFKNRPIKDGKVFGTMENERIAEKLNNPEEYNKIWGKKSTPSLRGHEEAATSRTKTLSSETSERERESLWKQPALYLAFASGLLIGLGIYWLFSKKNKAKSK